MGSVGLANATHEADHRYVLSGYVRDSVGVPVPDARVLLEHKGGEKKSVKTNNQGYYEVLFHLHNTNLGDQIIVKFGEETQKHKVEFDPEDKFTNRGVEISFGAPGKEGAVVWVYLTGGTLALFCVFLYLTFYKNVKAPKKALVSPKKKKKKSR